MGIRLRESLEPFVRELRGRERWLHVSLLALAALFLCYNYLGKEAFTRNDGYGIPALVSGDAKIRELRQEIQGIEETLAGTGAGEEALPLEEREALGQTLEGLRAELDGAAEGAPERTRIMHYMRYAGWFVSTFVFLFILPVAFIAIHPRLRLRDFGLGLGDWRFAGRIAVIFAGVMGIAVLFITVFEVKGFLSYYPLYAEKRITGAQPDFLLWFLLLEFCFLLYFTGWEFFFRALMLFPLEKRLGALSALVGVLPFALVHIGKPVAEAFGSILAAWFLSILVLRVRSFWICPILHFGVSFVMNLAAAISRDLF